MKPPLNATSRTSLSADSDSDTEVLDCVDFAICKAWDCLGFASFVMKTMLEENKQLNLEPEISQKNLMLNIIDKAFIKMLAILYGKLKQKSLAIAECLQRVLHAFNRRLKTTAKTGLTPSGKP